MAARQVKEVLDAVRDVHRQLADRYRELDEQATDERIKLLLKDMQQREEQFESCVAQYKIDHHDSVLNTWVRYLPDEVVHIDRLNDQLAEPRSLDELVEETIRLNGSLCNAYLSLAEQAHIPAMKELFQDLANLEEQNDCHYAKVLLES